MLPGVEMVLVSLVRSCLGMLRGILIEGDTRPRVHADVVVIALDNDLIHCVTVVSLAMSVPIVIVMMMVMVVAMAGVGQRRPSTDMNGVTVSFDDHSVDVVCVLRVVTVIVVMIMVMMAVVAMAWVQGAAVESGVAVHPADVDVRTRPTFFLSQWLYCRRRRAVLARMMRIGAPSQKRR